MSCSVDILESSRDLSKPRFPCYWNTRPDGLSRLDIFGLAVGESPGDGFANVPGGLPRDVVVTLTDIARVDKMLAKQEYIPGVNILPTLLAVRNATVHRLLSLPTWEELDDAERKDTDEFAYGICRITSILYANAVLLGIPPHNGWHKMIIERLRTIVEAARFDYVASFAPGYLVWSLVLAGIASYRTPHRQFFEQVLRAMLVQSSLNSWRSVRAVVGQFLWADSACEHGAAVLWDAIGIEDHGTGG